MSDDLIRPLAAFAKILRTIYPAEPDLASRFTSPEDFRRAAREHKFVPMTDDCPLSYYGDEPPPDHAWKPSEAMRLLRVGIWNGKIALQGEEVSTAPTAVYAGGVLQLAPIVHPSAPALIPPQHCAEGDFDPFEAELSVGRADPPVHFYRRVWCSSAAVDAWISELVPVAAQPTPPSAGEIDAASPMPQQAGPRRRRNTGQMAVRDAFKALYPDGLPSMAEMPPKAFEGSIIKWLKSNRPRVSVSPRHISRLAQRN